MKHTALYTDNLETARKNDELNEYRESLTANLECKEFIEKSVRDNYDGMHLNPAVMDSAISKFGYDRVFFILANTLQHKDYDGRFSTKNKIWAKEMYIPKDKNRCFYVVETHPAILDGVIDLVRKKYADLNLYDKSHCVSPTALDFENKIMVLNPIGIKDEYKKPEYQLFLAQSGFGCSPTAHGRQVFGMFLYDGEQTHFERSRFIGALKPEYIPSWAKQKIKEFQKPSVKEQLTQKPTQNSTPEKTNKDKGAR